MLVSISPDMNMEAFFNMAKSAEKIISDPEIGDVVLRKSKRSRSICIRVHPVRGVSVSVPYMVPYAVAQVFFHARRQWVLETLERQKEKFKDVRLLTSDEADVLRRQAKAELPSRLAELASRYGFIYNRVTIKHNATNWGSCSSKGNINLNLNIVRLPKVLQDYVLLHELCHLRHHDHGHAFHLLLEHVLTDNLMRMLEQPSGGVQIAGAQSGDASVMDADRALAAELARKAAVSKARYPLDYNFTRAIRQYRVA